MIEFQTKAAQVVLVRGGAGSGKTAWLVARAARLLAAGTQPADVVVLAASPQAAREMAAALPEGVRVTQARQVALDVLAHPQAQAATGRRAALLSPEAAAGFLEGLKTYGIRPKRLKELFKFLQRGWTELATQDEGWFATQEEVEVNELAQRLLADAGGVLECEAAPLAVQALLADDALRAACTVPHVLVDDAGCQSRASQVLACLLAGQTLAVAGDEATAAECFDSHPCPEGLAQMEAAFLGAEIVDLGEGAKPACQALAGALAAGPACFDGAARSASLAAHDAPRTVDAQAHATSEDELAAVAALVSGELARGTAPQRIYVACATPKQAARTARALQAAGVPVAAPIDERARANAADIALVPRATGCVPRPESVLVGVPALAAGCSFDLLVLTGFVGGNYPCADFYDEDTTNPNHAETVFARETRSLAAACAAAGRVAATCFQRMPASPAAAARLDIVRVRANGRDPEALVAPSPYLHVL